MITKIFLPRCTSYGNIVGGEGGFSNDGTLTLTNSTVSGNTASGAKSSNGGGISNGGRGTLTLTNSTVSGNTASGAKSSNGGGISNSGGSTYIDFCTIYGNNTTGSGGDLSIEEGQGSNGYKPSSLVVISSSIIAGGLARTGPDISGTLTSNGYNLIQIASGATFTPNKQQPTDVLGVSLTALGIDPMLQDNGGPTKTHKLLPGSPAIDLIPPDVCMSFGVSDDQRGVKRPQGKGCDSGAYEYSP